MRPWPLLLTPLLALFGCPASGSGDDDVAGGDDDDATPCAYPEGAVEPMAEGEVLYPYRWSTSLDADRNDAPLDLVAAHCTEGPLDWSPFDVLLFVSIPAW